MIDFLKRNVKFVTVIAIAVVVIAGLSTALILTNTGHGHRGKDRDAKPDRIMLIDEQNLESRDCTEERSAYATIDRSRRGDSAQRTDRLERSDRAGRPERADKAERLPLTEEQIAEKTEKILNKLEQKLADGEITQEEYEEKLEKIENGDFQISGRGGKSKKNKEITDNN